LADKKKSRNFSGKGKIVKKFQKVRKFFWNRGEIWNRGGKCIMVSKGDGCPCIPYRGWKPKMHGPGMYEQKEQTLWWICDFSKALKFAESCFLAWGLFRSKSKNLKLLRLVWTCLL